MHRDPERIVWTISREFDGKEVMTSLTQGRVDIARILAKYPPLTLHIKEDTLVKYLRHNGGVLHIELPNGIVNVRVGLVDKKGRAVDSVQVLPDCYAGESKVVVRGSSNIRLVRLKEVRR